MGVGLFEEGILIPKIQETTLSLLSLQTPWLRSHFTISSERALYHMYFSCWETQVIALYVLAVIEKKTQRPIDIFMPLRYSLDELVEWRALNLDVLRSYGVGTLTCIGSQGQKSRTLGIGKEINILTDKIPKQDLTLIQQHSLPFFGCTGDGSFSEAIALGKIPFYDIREHKRFFSKDLINRAKEWRLSKLQGFFEILLQQKTSEDDIYNALKPKKISFYQTAPSMDLREKESLPRVALEKGGLQASFVSCAEAVATFYDDGSLIEQAKEFSRHIQENYNAAPRLVQLAARALLQRECPQLITTESRLIKDFIEGRITEEDAVQMLAQAIINPALK